MVDSLHRTYAARSHRVTYGPRMYVGVSRFLYTLITKLLLQATHVLKHFLWVGTCLVVVHMKMVSVAQTLQRQMIG